MKIYTLYAPFLFEDGDGRASNIADMLQYVCCEYMYVFIFIYSAFLFTDNVGETVSQRYSDGKHFVVGNKSIHLTVIS